MTTSPFRDAATAAWIVPNCSGTRNSAADTAMETATRINETYGNRTIVRSPHCPIFRLAIRRAERCRPGGAPDRRSGALYRPLLAKVQGEHICDEHDREARFEEDESMDPERDGVDRCVAVMAQHQEAHRGIR